MAENARIETPSEPEQRVQSETNIRTPPSVTTRVSHRPPTAPAAADYNLRILWPLARYLQDVHGEETLERIAKKHGLEVEWLDGRTHWVTTAAFEGFVGDVHEICGSDEAFKRACVHRIDEAYGAMRYLLWAMSPSAVYEQTIKTYRIMSNIGDLEAVSLDRTHFHMRVKWHEPITRANCLVRQAQCAQLPTLWGLPAAHVHEDACLAWGDPTCELHFSWFDHSRRLPIFGGALAGMLFGFAVAHLTHSPGFALVFAFGLVGALIAHRLEARRSEESNDKTRSRMVEALRDLSEEEGEARREIMALNERQKDWERAIEEAHTSRLDAMQSVLKRADEVAQLRETTLLGFSHDLRNPLMVLASTVDFLRDTGDALGEEGPQLIEDVESSIEQMKRMLGDFVAAATSQQSLVRLSPKKLEVASLTSSLTRRLRALVHGKPIIPSVIQTREAPEIINLDPLVFDRVTDNLLTNAAKYTERGSIVVEVTGTPGFITIKISDSGRGISEASLEKIFTPGGSKKEERARDSFGVGLSVILQLLEQVGGWLEVMSAEGRGTTFWANFPTGFDSAVGPVPAAKDSDSSLSTGRALSSRVRIRKPPA